VPWSARSGAGRPRPAGARAAWPDRVARILANLAGAAAAAFFARASLEFYLHSHRLIGGLFFLEQAWFAVAFLIRRRQHAVSRGLGSWLLALGGTFGGLLFRPEGMHPQWGVDGGLALQFAGLAICVTALLAIGRSFGFVAADRGLKTGGAYGVVRHPVYASYLMIQSGYLLQSISVRNAVILLAVSSLNIGRALAEERLLRQSAAYAEYARRVPRRLIPGVW
jgi:protein-S-isoprenylcysteine O-methyltransferase Ste14